MTAFTARHAAYQSLDDVDVDVVGLSEDVDGGGRQLIFERARSFSDQDRELGMDTFAVTNETAATVYGAVTRYDVDDSVLTLDLTQEGADALGLPRTAHIGLELDPAEKDDLVAGLRAVLDAADVE
jgi:hypothetical protein